MAARAKPRPEPVSWVPAALLALAFLSSGAWMVTTFPPVPIAKALQLAGAGVWCVVFATGLVGWSRSDRRLERGLAALLAAVALSFALGGSHLIVLVYDLFADMPLVQWLAFPLVFLLAAGMGAEERAVWRGLDVSLAAAVLLSVVLAFQQLTLHGSGVFGSTAYSITALVPFIPIGMLAAHRATGRGRIVRYGAAGLIALALGAFSGSLMGLLGAGFAVLAGLSVHPALRGTRASAGRGVARGALVLAGIAVASLLLVQMPLVSDAVLTPARMASFDRNIATRAYLWQGSARMLAARPIAGFGPSGYRTAAVEYLDPEALQFGADRAGNIDPTVYSPQSPHSVFWEIATRLGLVGLAAFAFLGWCWVAVIRDRVRDDAAGADVRLALGAGFISSAFILLVNPVVFPIGLFAPAAAGLAVGTWGTRAEADDGARMTRVAFGIVGAALIALALWLGTGEWKAYNASADDPYAAVTQYRQVLAQLPGDPVIERRLLETRLLVAADSIEVAKVQAEVDDVSPAVRAFAPNLVSLATYSLAQAQRTERTDVSWEMRMLDAAEEKLPPIPSLVAERLHAAILSGDLAAVEAALPEAERWGAPYPYNEDYVTTAEELLSAR